MAERNKIYFEIILLLYSAFLTTTFISCKNKITAQAEDNAKFIASNGLISTGKFVSPKNPSKLTFIMLHGLGSSKEEWFTFADKLAAKGYGYFAYDLRGHNESIKDKAGNIISYKSFFNIGPDSEWELMIRDLDYAIKYLRRKGIKKENIGIMGASLGANIALIYASKHEFIKKIVLLSPGLQYAGLYTANAMKNYNNRKILIAASPKDQYPYESSVYLADIAKKQKDDIEFLSESGSKYGVHGVQMFDGKFDNKIIDWVEK
ncbi:MAG: hypothetical protein A2474_05755 [Elusimicrobia bacterium RIFOXYC2_FULL_34_12]|nr:MAG: hypothetical protein A2474_05755 [Elusimicrobia bacterium RIFOXYC2_FULL_34_12]